MMIVIVQQRRPSQSRSDARERMLRSTIVLLREQGLTGTSFGDVIEHSGAPRGSIYHHFPGGKAQLVEEAIRYAGDFLGGELERAAVDGDPVTAVRGFTAAWRDTLERTGFRAGCPVAAVAVEAHDDQPQLAGAAAEVFASWEATFARLLRGHGMPRARAARLATMSVATLEGAVILARARRDTAPIEAAGRELADLVAQALDVSR